MTGSPQIFNPSHRKAAQIRADRNFKAYNFMHEVVWDNLCDRLSDINKGFENTLILGRAGNQRPKSSKNVINVMSADLKTQPYGTSKIIAYEDFLPLKSAQFDLCLSALNLHTVNDLPGALIQICRTLKPDGLFIGAMFGGETLYELRQALSQAEIELMGGISPRIYPFADKPETGSLMQRAQFALPVVDSDIVKVTYSDIYALMRDIRGMGENNIIKDRIKHFTPRALFDRANEIYKSQFAEDDGRIRASFEVVYMHGWRPHESQQKPLKPGSARSRLADALNTEEISTGIKT